MLPLTKSEYGLSNGQHVASCWASSSLACTQASSSTYLGEYSDVHTYTALTPVPAGINGQNWDPA